MLCMRKHHVYMDSSFDCSVSMSAEQWLYCEYGYGSSTITRRPKKGLTWSTKRCSHLPFGQKRRRGLFIRGGIMASV